jgi:hypothetical protein
MDPAKNPLAPDSAGTARQKTGPTTQIKLGIKMSRTGKVTLIPFSKSLVPINSIIPRYIPIVQISMITILRVITDNPSLVFFNDGEIVCAHCTPGARVVVV